MFKRGFIYQTPIWYSVLLSTYFLPSESIKSKILYAKHPTLCMTYAPFSDLKGGMVLNFPTFKIVPRYSQGQSYCCEAKAFSALSRLCEYGCEGY